MSITFIIHDVHRFINYNEWTYNELSNNKKTLYAL